VRVGSILSTSFTLRKQSHADGPTNLGAGSAVACAALFERRGQGRAPGEGKPAIRHHVVVVGGGFGGLQAAFKLARLPVDVTLIDRRNFHLFQSLAYQVATGALSPAEISYPLRRIFRHRHNVRVSSPRSSTSTSTLSCSGCVQPLASANATRCPSTP
jgi:hypothetical protein